MPSHSGGSTARRLVRAGLLLFGAATALVHLDLTVRRPDRPIFAFDSAEYALAGRHLARTGTLATPFAHPAVLGKLDQPPFPLITGHPLVPLLDGALFAVGGPRPELTLIPPLLAYLGLILLAAALAERLSGSLLAGALAGGAVACSRDLLRYAAEGMTELPFTLAWTGALLLLLLHRERPRPVVLGAALGLAHLARPVVGPLLPVWLVLLAWWTPPGRRLRTTAIALAGFAPFAAALLLYKWLATGHPFTESGAHLLLTGVAPELTVAFLNCSIPPPDPLAYLAAHPDRWLAKIATRGPELLLAAFTRESLLVGVLLVSAATAPQASVRRDFSRALLPLLIGMVALSTLTVPNARYVIPFAPALWAVAVAEAFGLARAVGFRRVIAAALAGAVVVFGALYPTLRAWRHPTPVPFTERQWRGLGSALARSLPPGARVGSDIAPWVAWYADRVAVLLPNTPADLGALERELPLDALVVSNEWVIHQPGGRRWRDVFAGRERLPGWSTLAVISSGDLRALVLAHADSLDHSPTF
ncbi:MAG TPA: hypothetical protein VEY91_08605 [Candidatus Limnocylindria bacterium]|nr:hypothetical protein [Candidatus Limnocylindria bacterium]